MKNFIIKRNNFLSRDIQAFYNIDYVGYRKPGNPDYINVLKNTYNNLSITLLNQAVSELKSVFIEDWGYLVQELFCPLVICVVPRAKSNYSTNQLLFKSTISEVIEQMNNKWLDGQDSEAIFIDGTNFIIRHTNTKTTHLPPGTPNYNNDGPMPYPGITKTTCKISNNVKSKNIILIDDIYTMGVNIDEDAIQALLDNGANSVVFYAVAKTVTNRF